MKIKVLFASFSVMLIAFSALANPNSQTEDIGEILRNIPGATSVQLTQCISGIPISEYEEGSVIDILQPPCLQVTFESQESLDAAIASFAGQNRFYLGGQRVYLGPVANYEPID